MRLWLAPLLLVAEMALFISLSNVEFASFQDFLRYLGAYLADLLTQSAPVLILALGMTFVLMTAGIDLSIGSLAALVACVMSTFDGGPGFWWTAVPVGFVLAVALGAANGALIARLDMPPIIATLGTMIFYRGLCFVVMGAKENAPFIDTPGYEWFGQFPGAGILAFGLLAVVGAWFYASTWRRELLIIGGNRVAARYAGVPVDRRIVQTYAALGALGFFAALCFTAHNGAVSGSSLTGYELKVIVAVVLGGTRVQGGAGSVFGSVLGVLLVSVLDEGLRSSTIWAQDKLPFKISHLEPVLLGALLILGVWLNTVAPGRTKATSRHSGRKSEIRSPKSETNSKHEN